MMIEALPFERANQLDVNPNPQRIGAHMQIVFCNREGLDDQGKGRHSLSLTETSQASKKVELDLIIGPVAI